MSELEDKQIEVAYVDEFKTEHVPTEYDPRRSLLGNNADVVFCDNDYVETQCY